LVAVRLEISRFDQRRWQCSRIAGRRPWQCKEDEGLKEKRKMGTWRWKYEEKPYSGNPSRQNKGLNDRMAHTVPEKPLDHHCTCLDFCAWRYLHIILEKQIFFLIKQGR
jgi:hypothetical protein